MFNAVVRLLRAWVKNATIARPDAAPAFGVENVTQYSDIRYKRDMERMEDLIDRLTTIDVFAYTDIESGERRIGVSAQSVQQHLPEAVVTDADGKLSVTYGNLALAGLVEYIKYNEERVEDAYADIRAMRRRLDMIDKPIGFKHSDLSINKKRI